jgi:hypothetical protein
VRGSDNTQAVQHTLRVTSLGEYTYRKSDMRFVYEIKIYIYWL